jgi:hypothetical protein
MLLTFDLPSTSRATRGCRITHQITSHSKRMPASCTICMTFWHVAHKQVLRVRHSAQPFDHIGRQELQHESAIQPVSSPHSTSGRAAMAKDTAGRPRSCTQDHDWERLVLLAAAVLGDAAEAGGAWAAIDVPAAPAPIDAVASGEPPGVWLLAVLLLAAQRHELAGNGCTTSAATVHPSARTYCQAGRARATASGSTTALRLHP